MRIVLSFTFSRSSPLRDDKEDLHGEVLIRMHDESDNIISPGLFLPAAERYHLMPAIDRWRGRANDRVARKQPGTSTTYSDVLISINLSGQTLSDHSFVSFVHDVLEASVIPATNLCFEITETTAIADVTQAQRFIKGFNERGVRFSLDDFGTGLSTFSYLKELPVDFLKIDGSFIKEICDDPIAETMVIAINEVAHSMNLRTIGEFVENDAILSRLTELNVDYGQGYGIAKPGPLFGLPEPHWSRNPTRETQGERSRSQSPAGVVRAGWFAHRSDTPPAAAGKSSGGAPGDHRVLYR